MNGMVEATGGPMAIQSVTLTERMESEEKNLTERLDKVKKLRATLAENPDIQSVMDLLTELGQYHY